MTTIQGPDDHRAERRVAADIVPAPPVYEAEPVEAPPPAGPGTAVEKWRRIELIPQPHTRAIARQAVLDATVRVLTAPWRLLRAVTRGLVHAARAWRRWVRVHDYREAA